MPFDIPPLYVRLAPKIVEQVGGATSIEVVGRALAATATLHLAEAGLGLHLVDSDHHLPFGQEMPHQHARRYFEA